MTFEPGSKPVGIRPARDSISTYMSRERKYRANINAHVTSMGNRMNG